MKSGSSKEWSQKMVDLRNHKSSLNVDVAWRELELKMQQKRKRRIILFWFLLVGLAGYVLVTAKLTTTRPLHTIAGTKGINGNDKVAYYTPQRKVLTDTKAILGTAGYELQMQTNRVASGAQLSVGEREVFTLTAPVAMVIEEENSIRSAVTKEEMEDVAFMERDEFIGSTMLLPLPTLLPGCKENEAEEMPLVMVGTKTQNTEAVWWLMVQGGSGVQYFNYSGALGEAGLIDRVKAIEKPGIIYQGRLGLGRDIGKRYFVSAGLSGLSSSEEHTGILVDTVVGFKENVLISSYRDHDGSLIEEYGNVMTTTVRKTTKMRYPGFSTISLFLGLGKKWLVGKSLIQLEVAYQQRLLAGMRVSGINANQIELDFAQLYKLKSSSWIADLNYSLPVYRNVWMRAGCMLNQSTLVAPAFYTRHNTSLSAQLGLAWTLK